MESYRDWVRYAQGAATQWAQNAPRERWSEPALSIYARMLAKDRPEEALALVARFTDGELRDRITIVITPQVADEGPEGGLGLAGQGRSSARRTARERAGPHLRAQR
jgi:hypothetical protein